MRRVVVLLDTLPLALRCAFYDRLDKERHELANGPSLVEGERGEIGALGEDGACLARGSEYDGEREDLHAATVVVEKSKTRWPSRMQ